MDSFLIWRGHTHFGWPWGSRERESNILSADDDRITLTSHGVEIWLRSVKVLRIERAGLLPCLWRGLLITHNQPQYPCRIGFVPEEVPTKEILERLRERGYWVDFD